jgi:hypothetical protein
VRRRALVRRLSGLLAPTRFERHGGAGSESDEQALELADGRPRTACRSVSLMVAADTARRPVSSSRPGRREVHARQALVVLVGTALDRAGLLHGLQHLAHGGSRKMQGVGEIALGDAVVGRQEPQADGLAGVSVAFGKGRRS